MAGRFTYRVSIDVFNANSTRNGVDSNPCPALRA